MFSRPPSPDLAALFRSKGDPEQMERFADLSADRITTEWPRTEAADRLTSLLKKIASPVGRDRGERIFLYAHQGAFSHFGVQIVHAGVLIMMAGVMVGLFWILRAT